MSQITIETQKTAVDIINKYVINNIKSTHLKTFILQAIPLIVNNDLKDNDTIKTYEDLSKYTNTIINTLAQIQLDVNPKPIYPFNSTQNTLTINSRYPVMYPNDTVITTLANKETR